VSASTGTRAGGLPLAGLALLLTLSLFWGAAWPINKVVMAEVPLFAFRSVCLGVSALALVAFTRLGGQRVGVPARWWPRLVLASLFNVVMWNVLVPIGILLLPAGRASVLFYTTPAWAGLLGWLVLRERLGPRRILGIVLALSAVAVLVGDDIRAIIAAPIGVACILGGSMFWAAGAVVMRGFPSGLPTSALAAWQLIISLPVFFLGFALFERDVLHPISGAAWTALAYTIVIGCVFGYWAWFRLVRMVPVAVSAVGSLLIPIVAVLSAIVITRESPGPAELIALALVSTALLAVALPERRS
jgi:drug/metabolite transporter (DMT)-like permease